MKEKTKKTVKVVIIVIAALIIMLALLIIGMFLLNGTTPKSDIRIKFENYIEDYNRSCDADKQVKIDYYYEGGPHIHCNLKFSKEIPADTETITAFLLTFHNEFGYENLCNAEINSEFFRKYDEVNFEFENIRISYGDNKVLPNPLELEIPPEDIDVTIYGLNQIMYFDPETISKFKGTVYAFKLDTDIPE